eukprot:scpid33571/ scgid29464/ 
MMNARFLANFPKQVPSACNRLHTASCHNADRPGDYTQEGSTPPRTGRYVKGTGQDAGQGQSPAVALNTPGHGRNLLAQKVWNVPSLPKRPPVSKPTARVFPRQGSTVRTIDSQSQHRSAASTAVGAESQTTQSGPRPVFSKPTTPIMSPQRQHHLTWGKRDPQQHVTSSPPHSTRHSNSYQADTTDADKRNAIQQWPSPPPPPTPTLHAHTTEHDHETRTADSHQYPKVRKLNLPQTLHVHTTEHDQKTHTADSHQYPKVRELNPTQTSHAHKDVHRTGASSGSSPSNRTETGDILNTRF